MEIVLSVGFLLTQQRKILHCCPKPSYCSNQLGDIFKFWAQLEFLLRWTGGVFKILKEFKLVATLQKTL